MLELEVRLFETLQVTCHGHSVTPPHALCQDAVAWSGRDANFDVHDGGDLRPGNADALKNRVMHTWEMLQPHSPGCVRQLDDGRGTRPRPGTGARPPRAARTGQGRDDPQNVFSVDQDILM
ncbi:hypothetical protein DES52_107171 [Deinococcus yavapaiensis KR-236]|uniref:Uncharacterized protein n=1 Tax=Deinococcus yavapaiensis KR-236 TaxID=694435 RepID=A0A318S6S3_9DEIO|nr:hypothetical protein DES52_107171 [Deinococcus yavapaiensis KR-236]